MVVDESAVLNQHDRTGRTCGESLLGGCSPSQTLRLFTEWQGSMASSHAPNPFQQTRRCSPDKAQPFGSGSRCLDGLRAGSSRTVAVPHNPTAQKQT